MILIQGKGVSKGVVKGPLYFFRRQDGAVVKTQVEDLAAEKARLAKAQEKSIAQLEILAEKCREEAGDEAAILFETHAMFVEDDDYVECIENCLEEAQSTRFTKRGSSLQLCSQPWTMHICRPVPQTSGMYPSGSLTI